MTIPDDLLAKAARGLLETHPGAAFLLSPEGRVLRTNGAGQALLRAGGAGEGGPAETHLGTLPLEDAEGRPLAGDVVGWAQAASDAPLVRLLRPGAEPAWLEVEARPLDGEAGERLGTLLVFRDVTEAVVLRARLQDCLRTVSHDLRNPLMALQLHVRLLERIMPEEGGARALEALHHNMRRLQGLSEDLSDEAALRAGELALSRQPLDLGVLLDDLLPQLTGEKDRARLEVELPEGLPLWDADRARIERVLEHLVSRGLRVSRAPQPVRVTARDAGDAVELSISDAGPPLGEEERLQIFDRYRRADAPTRGGFALWVARRLVEAHGGSLRAEAGAEAGTTFVVRLPTWRQ